MPRKILMIDDDRLQFRVTQAHFKNFQAEAYELVWAETYEKGLEELMAGGYVACLLDYQLGPRDGLQLIREAIAGGVPHADRVSDGRVFESRGHRGDERGGAGLSG